MRQLSMFKPCSSAYGGDLLKTRKGRKSARPLSTKHSMHVVLRSTQAKGKLSFLRHRHMVEGALKRFGEKFGVDVYNQSINGNHIHLQILVSSRRAYKAFIRALTAYIAMKVTGVSRWKKSGRKFWDRRPFSRIAFGHSAFMRLRNYILLNIIETQGFDRQYARLVVKHYSERDRALSKRGSGSLKLVMPY